MTNNLFNLAAGGALIGVIASFWTYIKSVVWKFITLFIQRVEIRCNGYLSPVLLGYLIRKYPRSRVYDRTYGAMNEHIREQERHGMVPFEEFGENSLIFWNGWLPFVFSQSSKGQSAAPSSSPPGYPTSGGQDKAAQYITLTFIRGTLDVEKIVYEATEERNQLNWSNEQLTKQSQQRFYIKYIPNFNKAREGIAVGDMPMSSLPWYQEGKYRLIGYKPDQLGRGRREQQSALGNLIFPDRITSLIEEIKLWRVNRDWYHRRGIPWKRGWLLYGPPGCLHPDTPIYDPVDGSNLTVATRYRLGANFHVLSMTANGKVVVAKAEPPHKYTEASMLTFKLADGNQFTVTPHHRLLVGSEWNTAERVATKLRAGVAVQLRTTSAGTQSTRAEDDLHSTGITASSRSNYSTYSYPYGVQPRAASNTELGVLPLRADARQRSRVTYKADAQVYECTHNPQRAYVHLSTVNCIVRAALQTAVVFVCLLLARLCAGAFCWSRLRQQLAGVIVRPRTMRQQSNGASMAIADVLTCSCNQDRIATHELAASGSSQVVSESLVSTNRLAAGLTQTGNHHLTVSQPLSSSDNEWSIYDTAVTGVEEAQSAVYFDFHVPVHENYWACGAFHHNTGKTALARAFAEDLDMPIWVYNLNELTNFMFMRNWIEMQSSAPSIALIEDIDNVFHGRVSVNGGRRDPMSLFYNMGPKKNRKMASGINSPLNGDSGDDKGSDDEESMMCGMLSFDVFLNMLDGVERNDGIFTIITTNNLDAVDEALGKPRKKEDGTFDFISTRPGRVDKAIELTYMTRRDKIRMAQKILTGYPEAMDQIIRHMNTNPELDETPAQFQERCAQLALQVFWQEQGGVLLNADRTLGSRYKEANQVPPIFSTEDGTFYPTDVEVAGGSVGVAQKGTFDDSVGHLTENQEFWAKAMRNGRSARLSTPNGD